MRDLEIVLQRVEVRMAQRDRRFVEPALALAHAEKVIGAGLDPDFDRLAAQSRGAKRHDPLARLAMLAGERRVDVGEAEERPPLLVDDATLAIDVDQEDDILAGGAIRHRAGKAKPGAVEHRLAPPIAGLEAQL